MNKRQPDVTRADNKCAISKTRLNSIKTPQWEEANLQTKTRSNAPVGWTWFKFLQRCSGCLNTSSISGKGKPECRCEPPTAACGRLARSVSFESCCWKEDRAGELVCHTVGTHQRSPEGSWSIGKELSFERKCSSLQFYCKNCYWEVARAAFEVVRLNVFNCPWLASLVMVWLSKVNFLYSRRKSTRARIK